MKVPLAPVEAGNIFEQVRERIRLESLSPATRDAVRFYSGPVRTWRGVAGRETPPTLQSGSGHPSELAHAEQSIRALQATLAAGLETSIQEIGQIPPSPETLRGRAGHFLIRILQRLLWWQTRSVRAFAESTANQLNDQVWVLLGILRELESSRAEVAALREEVKSLRGVHSDRTTGPKG